MKITKYGQSCLLLEYKSKIIAVDPGNYVSVKEIEAWPTVGILVITHEHADHFLPSNIEILKKKNPNLTIITNSAVAEKLNIETVVLEGSSSTIISQIEFVAHDAPHEEIYEEFGQVQNTGYYIDDYIFCPGDAFAKPKIKVRAVAIPITAPFLRVRDVIEYCHHNPKILHIGVHEGVASENGKNLTNTIIKNNVADGVRYNFLEIGESVNI